METTQRTMDQFGRFIELLRHSVNSLTQVTPARQNDFQSPSPWAVKLAKTIRLTSCKVHMKMRVHRPLQQPIVSAVETWLWAGRGKKRGGGRGYEGVGGALDAWASGLSADPSTAVPFSSGRSLRLPFGGSEVYHTAGWLTGWLESPSLTDWSGSVRCASAPGALEVTGWVVGSHCVKGGGGAGGGGWGWDVLMVGEWDVGTQSIFFFYVNAVLKVRDQNIRKD